VQEQSRLVTTPTAIETLRCLAIHVSLCVPTLLTSAPSSGKRLVLSHLANLVFPGVQNQVITIHLADTSLDPRSLLGSYASSATRPGAFEWKEGVLVRAMREGKWVVFEDVDRGSNEVLGVIKPLIDSLGLEKWIGGRASLQLPGRDLVRAAETFAIFATRSLIPSRTGDFASPTFFGAHKFFELILPSPTLEELKSILTSRFPRLAGGPVHALINLWESVKALGTLASARDFGLRELEKFATRVESLLPVSYVAMDVEVDNGASLSFSSVFPNPALREEIYLEARDVFFGSGALTASARAHMEAVAAAVGEHMGLEPERRDWVLSGRLPEFEVETDVNGRTVAVCVGRRRLLAKSTKVEMIPAPQRPFTMHKPAVLLLSRIATAISLGEPVLLSGETGTGKTSIITHLASTLRRPLVSLNLSHQTESSDLIGGFKPIDAKVPGSELQERFLDLFGETFSRKKNAKFEEAVRKAVVEGKWKRVVGLWKESVRLAKERIRQSQTADLQYVTVLLCQGSDLRVFAKGTTLAVSWHQRRRGSDEKWIRPRWLFRTRRGLLSNVT
jgi:midasin